MTDAENTSGADENKLIAERRAKLTALRARGNPFPNAFRRTARAAELQSAYGEQTKEALEEADQHFCGDCKMFTKAAIKTGFRGFDG